MSKEKKPIRLHGWAHPQTCLEWHYFDNCRSLCGAYQFAGRVIVKTPAEAHAGKKNRQAYYVCEKCQRELNRD